MNVRGNRFNRANMEEILHNINERLDLKNFEMVSGKNKEISFNEVFENIVSRDKLDINRSNSPLIKASDAILIDTENLNLDQVESKILEYINFSNLNS